MHSKAEQVSALEDANFDKFAPFQTFTQTAIIFFNDATGDDDQPSFMGRTNTVQTALLILVSSDSRKARRSREPFAAAPINPLNPVTGKSPPNLEVGNSPTGLLTSSGMEESSRVKETLAMFHRARANNSIGKSR